MLQNFPHGQRDNDSHEAPEERIDLPLRILREVERDEESVLPILAPHRRLESIDVRPPGVVFLFTCMGNHSSMNGSAPSRFVGIDDAGKIRPSIPMDEGARLRVVGPRAAHRDARGTLAH